MVIASLVFYLFAAVLVFSALMVVSARNPVHSVLFLILAFFNAAGLFLLIGAEYLAMTLVIVVLLATLGLWAVGMPFWLILGAIVGVANLIPMFGAWIGAVPVPAPS